jgi:hypothetical protein
MVGQIGFEPNSDCVKSPFLYLLFTVNLKSRLSLEHQKEPLKAMSEHVTSTHRSQTVLFPDTIDKYVEKENPLDSSMNSLTASTYKRLVSNTQFQRNRKTFL